MPKTANKPIIAVDIDEVLMPHFQDLADWYNKNYGTKLTLANNHPKNTEGWGTDSFEEAVRRVQKFLVSDTFKKSKPFEEAKDAIRQLAQKYKLVVITSRDDLVRETTHRWLTTHFENLFEETHFTAMYSLKGGARHKADIAKEMGVDYLIDDSLEHIEKAIEAGITGLLFGDYPWQRKELIPTRAVRVKNWQEVLEYFDATG
jgi:uncharacterized HAD superfamily protein